MTRLLITVSLIFLAAFPAQLPAQDTRTAIHEQADQVQPLLPGVLFHPGEWPALLGCKLIVLQDN